LRLLLTGRTGQVGWELERLLSPLGELFAFDRPGLDLADGHAITSRMREVRPNVVVNAAAYTAVDGAESERDLVMKINASAPGILAEECKSLGALLVHYSTDYVFDGTKKQAYDELDPPNPLNVYGLSKLEGEKAIRATGCAHIILRTAWVYGARGRNFLRTMLRLASEGKPLRIVNDQFGAPTWSREIAQVTACVLARMQPDQRDAKSTYHLAAGGRTTWFDFARRIFELGGVPAKVIAIDSQEYPTPAARPKNSTLDCRKLQLDFGLSIPAWERGVKLVMDEIR
jgi:dTDP-4-dehydrorhamnose reductase